MRKATWTLTVKEKTLLHLFDFFPPSRSFERAFLLTQEGIAESIGIMRSAVPRAMKELINDNLVTSELCHVTGLKRRRKCYLLTHDGFLITKNIRDRLKEVKVEVNRGESKELEILTLEECSTIVGTHARMIDLIRTMEKKGYIDLPGLIVDAKGEDVPTQVHREGKHHNETIPGLRHFFGRVREIKDIGTAFDEGYRFVVIYGLAGIGKTTLGARYAGKKVSGESVFWHRFYSWDDKRSLFMELGEFLRGRGLPQLIDTMTRYTDKTNIPGIARTLIESLEMGNFFFVFDDFHMASDDIVELMVMMKNEAARFNKARFLILSRGKKKFYDVRDTVLEKKIFEMKLHGLDEDSVEKLLSAVTETSVTGKGLSSLMEMSKGHPLAVELIGAKMSEGIAPEELHDMSEFMENEIFSKLDSTEKQVLQYMSIARTPVEVEHLIFNRSLICIDGELALVSPESPTEIGWSTLNSLISKNLLIRDGAILQIHDIVTDFFKKWSSPEMRREAHRRRADYLFQRLKEMTSNKFLNGKNKKTAACIMEKEDEDDLLAFFHHLMNCREYSLLGPFISHFHFLFHLVFRQDELAKTLELDSLDKLSGNDGFIIFSLLGDIRARLGERKLAEVHYLKALSSVLEEVLGQYDHTLPKDKLDGGCKTAVCLGILHNERDKFEITHVTDFLVIGLKTGRLLMKDGEWQAAKVLFEEGANLALGAKLGELKADYLAAMGWTHHHLGDIKESRRFYNDCLDTLINEPDIPGAIRRNLTQGKESSVRGDIEVAMAFFDKCMNYFEGRDVAELSKDTISHIGDHYMKMLLSTYLNL
ncbi:MAG: NB-ARC domain-containing protein [Candidatus Thermoplasmatota archaeon]|nr:NB-ARC domain-containing protein [Candidatus Thermoplasmatota archaeon]